MVKRTETLRTKSRNLWLKVRVSKNRLGPVFRGPENAAKPILKA